jgi:hypothetical protein
MIENRSFAHPTISCALSSILPLSRPFGVQMIEKKSLDWRSSAASPISERERFQRKSPAQAGLFCLYIYFSGSGEISCQVFSGWKRMKGLKLWGGAGLPGLDRGRP